MSTKIKIEDPQVLFLTEVESLPKGSKIEVGFMTYKAIYDQIQSLPHRNDESKIDGLGLVQGGDIIYQGITVILNHDVIGKFAFNIVE